MTGTTNGRRLTRGDVEAAFAKTLGEAESTARAVAPQALVLAAALSLTAITLAYLAGRRRGRRRSARIEIRQV